MMKLATFTLLLSSTIACAKSVQGIKACDKSVKFESHIIQKIQKISGIETKHIKLELEDHYYPQMTRPKTVIVSSDKKVKDISFIGSDRQSERVKVNTTKDGVAQFSLPTFKTFNGKILVHFESDDRCERKIIFEELSP